MTDDQSKAPTVFVSYSHDNPRHKQWVAGLASRLVENGVDVILDQWDLVFGDDVPKFMENALSRADRVLMVCTEQYVKKADDGRGGVGYEAMIVTGELIKNLGSSKFIPVVRQGNNEALLPKSLSTRFYVNLGIEDSAEEQFELLLRELHKVPAVKKPPLGKSPFGHTPSGGEASTESPLSVPPTDALGSSDDPVQIYNAALAIARRGDLVEWRRLARTLNSAAPHRLTEFRKRWEPNPPRTEDSLPEFALDAASAYVFSMIQALAGVESGREKFSNQIGLLEDILYPAGWSRAGVTLIGDIPITVAFVYQALHGAVCLETGQLKAAMNFAKTKVTLPDHPQVHPLHDLLPLTGWPDGLHHNATLAWNFLKELPTKWPWLNQLFGDPEEFRAALCAYYMGLNVLELAATVAAGNKGVVLSQERIHLTVPLCFANEERQTTRKAYRLLTSDREQVTAIWRDLKVEDATMNELWPRWIFHCKGWVENVYKWNFRGDIPHEQLISEST